jgi:HK97 family phage major capsid protein
MDVNTMTRDEAVDRLEEIHEQMERMASKHRMSNRDEHDFVDLKDEFDLVSRHVDKLERAGSIAAAAKGGGGKLRVERGGVDPYDQDDPRQRVQRRDGAMRTIDRLVSSNLLPPRSAETVEALTKTGSGLEQSWTQRMVEALGDDAYMRAFSRVMADPERGHLMWDKQEQQAFQTVQQLRGEMRSMNTTDDAGGFLAPIIIDPSIQISSAGSINPLRQLARNVQTISDSWRGITSNSVVAHFIPEEGEVSDDSPTLAETIIPVWKEMAFVPASYEIIQDGTNFVQEISKLLMDGLEQLSATAFTTGSGTGEPTGLITALAGTGSVVNTATADTLVSGDVYNLLGQLPPRFQGNAQWAANLSILNSLRQMVSGSIFTFPELRENPPMLVGLPISQISNMDGSLGGGAGNDPVLVIGDFSQFVIVNRWPATLEVISNLFGAARRFPTGQRGFLLHARVGSDVLVDNAFRVLTA